jgi:hypothetical protein
MPDQLIANERIERLRTLGDAHDNMDWASGETDYVTEFSLTADDIPALIALAQRWGKQNGDDDPDSDDNAVYGPVHAWRALGQLRAFAAVEPLLGLLDRLDQLGDDWYLEEFPDVFGQIGPQAIPPLPTSSTPRSPATGATCATSSASPAWASPPTAIRAGSRRGRIPAACTTSSPVSHSSILRKESPTGTINARPARKRKRNARTANQSEPFSRVRPGSRTDRRHCLTPNGTRPGDGA